MVFEPQNSLITNCDKFFAVCIDEFGKMEHRDKYVIKNLASQIALWSLKSSISLTLDQTIFYAKKYFFKIPDRFPVRFSLASVHKLQQTRIRTQRAISGSSQTPLIECKNTQFDIIAFGRWIFQVFFSIRHSSNRNSKL